MRDNRNLRRMMCGGRTAAIALAVLFAGCSTTPEPEAGPPTIDELLVSSNTSEIYQRANESFDQGDYLTAHRLYVRVIELESHHVGALVNAGLSARRLGDIDGAIGWYDRALATAPEDATALQNRLLAGLLLGRTAESIVIAERLAAVEPTVVEYRVQLGDLYLQSGNYPEAIRQFDQAATLDPTSSESLYKKGLAAAGLNQLDVAIEALRAATALDPDYRAAYPPLANALLIVEDYDAAWLVVTEGQQRGAQFDPGFILELQEKSKRVGPD